MSQVCVVVWKGKIKSTSLWFGDFAHIGECHHLLSQDLFFLLDKCTILAWAILLLLTVCLSWCSICCIGKKSKQAQFLTNLNFLSVDKSALIGTLTKLSLMRHLSPLLTWLILIS
jgi:hypothetical protein